MKKRIIIIVSIVIVVLIAIFGGFKIKSNKNNTNEYIGTDYIVKEDDFNLKLIKEVNKNKKENYLISPYSIEIALNLLKEGADGNTLTEINNLVKQRKISDVIIKDRVSIANAIFIKEDYKNNILKSYTNILQNKYDSEILYDKFTTPQVINDWVNKKTDGMIDKLLDSIDNNFVLGLANALAIDVEWYNEFECIDTQSKEFTKANGDKIDVEMMEKTIEYDTYKYLENSGAQGIVIPYKTYNKKTGKEEEKGNNLEFIAILPKYDINEYINNLNHVEIANLLVSARKPSKKLQINLSLPRFRYDYELKDFKDVLINLGIKDAFDEKNANFSKMADTIDNVYIKEAIHKTHIDLNEKGTKAAAVTYFGAFAMGAYEKPVEKEIIDIEFNKPFIYAIVDKKTEEILFFGVVHEPNKWEGKTCKEEE